MKKIIENIMGKTWTPILVGGFVLFIAFATMRGLNFIGIIIIILGELIYGYNNFVMGKAWSVKVKKTSRLVKEGLFKYIRHPLYLGVIISYFGLSILFKSMYSFIANLIITLPFFYYRAKLEEKLLSKTC